MTPQEQARDKRLRKTYGWTLEMVNQLSEVQGHRCYACGREAKTMPLNIDHEHFKIESHRIITEYPDPKLRWEANTKVGGRVFSCRANTKIAAIKSVKEMALPYSVRGLLCAGRYAGCNRKLGRIDDPKWLRRCADYLDNPPAWQLHSVISTV